MKERSAVLVRPGAMEMQQFPLPEIGPDDLLLRIEMCSVCGSDRRLWGGTLARAAYPLIPGHEMVGWVERVGDNAAKAYGVREGDRVTPEPYVLCKNCRYCLQGFYQLCESTRCYGVNISCSQPPHLWGGYGEYIYIAPNSKLHRIADDIPAEAACLSSVIGNGIRWAREKAQMRLGDSVVISGPGAQGLAATIAAREAGADPIVLLGVEKDALRFELAKAFGATHVVDVEREDPVSVVKSLTDGRGADVVIDCTGSVASLQRTVELAAKLGRCVIVGHTNDVPVPLRSDRIVYKELTIRGGVGQPWNVEDAVRIINSRRYPIERMITHKFPLGSAPDAIRFFLESSPHCIRVALTM